MSTTPACALNKQPLPWEICARVTRKNLYKVNSDRTDATQQESFSRGSEKYTAHVAKKELLTFVLRKGQVNRCDNASPAGAEKEKVH